MLPSSYHRIRVFGVSSSYLFHYHILNPVLLLILILILILPLHATCSQSFLASRLTISRYPLIILLLPLLLLHHELFRHHFTIHRSFTPSSFTLTLASKP